MAKCGRFATVCPKHEAPSLRLSSITIVSAAGFAHRRLFVVLSAPAIDLRWRAPPFHPPSASDDLRSFTVARSALREVRALDHHVASDDRCRTSHASMRDP
jgi:hypothetical protein